MDVSDESICYICYNDLNEEYATLSKCNHILCISCLSILKNELSENDKKYFICPFDRIRNFTALTTYINTDNKPQTLMTLLPDKISNIIDNTGDILEMGSKILKLNFISIQKNLFLVKNKLDKISTSIVNTEDVKLGITTISDERIKTYFDITKICISYYDVDQDCWNKRIKDAEIMCALVVESMNHWNSFFSYFVQYLSDTNDKPEEKLSNILFTKSQHDLKAAKKLLSFLKESFIRLCASVFQYSIFESNEYLSNYPSVMKKEYRRCMMCFSKSDEFFRFQLCNHKICVTCAKMGHYTTYVCPIDSVHFHQQIMFIQGSIRQFKLDLLNALNKSSILEKKLYNILLNEVDEYTTIIRHLKNINNQFINYTDDTVINTYLKTWAISDIEAENNFLQFIDYLFLLDFSHKIFLMCWQYIIELKRLVFDILHFSKCGITDMVNSKQGVLEVMESELVIWMGLLNNYVDGQSFLDILLSKYPEGDFFFKAIFNFTESSTEEYCNKFGLLRTRQHVLESFQYATNYE